jgi:iron-sulfur cluster assembly accessory protein
MFIYHIMHIMIKRLFSTINSYSITITNAAWNKMDDIVKKKEDSTFLFSASSGGCNGYNYDLHLIDKEKYEKIIMMYSGKFKPTIMKKKNTKIVVEPVSEILLSGTTIDYVSEDYENGVFENKFVFTPDKKLASSCGCGISFTPKD